MAEVVNRVAILAPMPNELRPLVRFLGLRRSEGHGDRARYLGEVGGTEVIATRTGIGPDRAREVTTRLLDETPVDRVIVSGIAGGIPGMSEVGDLLVPADVIDRATGARFGATPFGGITLQGTIRTGDGSDYGTTLDDLDRLREDGVVALDMETAAVAEVCDRRSIPWMAFRAISDMAGDPALGPDVMGLVDDEGHPRKGAAARYFLTHPGRIVRFLRLGFDARQAAVAAARAAADSVVAGSE